MSQKKSKSTENTVRADIGFSAKTSTFHAGNVISGNVILETTEMQKLKGVKLLFQGISSVHWDERRSYTKGSASQLSHKTTESFLCANITVSEKTVLQPGAYEWSFEFALPDTLPSTFEGQHGRIFYWAKVIFERQWPTSDIEHTRPFIVLGFLDLSKDVETQKPTLATKSEKVGCLCAQQPITAEITFPRRGFLPGENIPFTVSVDNKTTKKVSARIILLQHITFRANKKMRKIVNILRAVTRDEMKAGQLHEWAGMIEAIPPLPPSHLGPGCKSIDVTYIIKLVVEPRGPGKEIEIPVDILIGTLRSRPRSTYRQSSKSN